MSWRKIVVGSNAHIEVSWNSWIAVNEQKKYFFCFSSSLPLSFVNHIKLFSKVLRSKVLHDKGRIKICLEICYLFRKVALISAWPHACCHILFFSSGKSNKMWTEISVHLKWRKRKGQKGPTFFSVMNACWEYKIQIAMFEKRKNRLRWILGKFLDLFLTRSLDKITLTLYWNHPKTLLQF
jgi:hypothetical protein